jgi:AcrR family transcriptional regulator
LESAARGLSRYGYANLVLEQVAKEAGYTRGALYHLFPSKAGLALAVVDWVEESWYAELGDLLRDGSDPVKALVSVAQGHAVFCRQDVARVMMTLRVEFSSRDHPVGRAVMAVVDRLIDDCTRLISIGRESGAIPPGPPAKVMAIAYLGALEGLVISLEGKDPFDVQLAERVALGVLGVAPDPSRD